LTGAKRDTVVLNSALCFYIADKVETVEDGIKLANELIDSGKAYEQLEKYVSLTNKY
ncbi:MAG: anthranilate phosphoribosyltransferase, partial [Pseudoruminococcus massiliensis]